MNLIECETHGQQPGQVVCVHLVEAGGDYFVMDGNDEGHGDYICPDCFNFFLLATEDEGNKHLTSICLQHFNEEVLPKLERNLGELRGYGLWLGIL